MPDRSTARPGAEPQQARWILALWLRRRIVLFAVKEKGDEQNGPRNHEGRFSYFDFCDEDLMRSSSFRNSLVSSSIDLEGGLGGKGITSDKVEPPLVHVRAVCLSSPAIDAFLRRSFFSPVRNLP
jgi:hypothetical protein